MKKSILITFLVLSFFQVFSQEKVLNNFFANSFGATSYTKPSYKDFGLIPSTTISYTRFNKYMFNFSVEYLYSVKQRIMSYYTNYINGNQLLLGIGQAFIFKNRIFLNFSISFGTLLTYSGIYLETEQRYQNSIPIALILSPKIELNYLFKNNSFVGLKFIYNNDSMSSNKSYNFFNKFWCKNLIFI